MVPGTLPGLSKSLGLIEGFGGRGKGGLPATLLPLEENDAKYLREKYGYNAYLSDRISLDRTIPDHRPSKCRKVNYSRDLPQISLIFIFVNEALSVILRSVHSAVNHTPAHLLKEIILVDDNSDDELLKRPLEEYVNKRYPGLVKIVRNQKREGLIRARIEGWKVATAEVTGFFDAHVEFTPSWTEQNSRTETLARGAVLQTEHACLLSQNHGIDYGDVSQRIALRKSLQCRSFQWYLDNVYPEMRRYNNTLHYGEVRNSKVSHLCLDQGMKENHTATLHPCHGWGPQLGRFTKEGQLFLGPLGSTGEDTRCVVDDQLSSFPQLLNCDKVPNMKQKTWTFSQNEAIVNRATGRCLEVVPANVYFGHLLVLQPCSGQRWTIKNTMKQ
ncbi:polypeptide N-acetylgalactosaminyltransferase 17 [Nematolebias whitei]|uniref:polypeptide N-acetylgalactosaminyltransferase 17 n=1 Tax=Nematolebias whitei TaxID=451745 RepID=UPI00189AC4A3|nr:polypeptide N-acetylgalactosaminyltransferase 17 [Nematolebias whitei]